MSLDVFDSINQVFVLGAGFSRAISERMPLTDELGNLAQKRGAFESRMGAFRGGQFEAWLSRRAEPQPYLGAADTLANQALFARATEIIAEILDERVSEVLGQALPTWLGELISIWHLRQSHVITFNYDPLVECAFQTMQFYDWRRDTRFTWGSLINYSPGGMAGASFGEAGLTSSPHPSFRLWKLHGSLNWWWVQGDSTGATVRRVRLPGTFGSAEPFSLEEAHWSVPGRERYIAPPAALKSSHYGNPTTRGIWEQAYGALKNADQVTLMGYSLPQTDLSTSGMVAEAYSDDAAKQFIVVDREEGGRGIAARLRALLGPEVKIDASGCGDGAIETYVARQLAAAATEAISRLRSLSCRQEKSLFVDWGPIGEPLHQQGRSAAIVKVTQENHGHTLVLHSEDLDVRGTTTRSRRDLPDNSPRPIAHSTLLPMLADVKRLVVRVPQASADATVIDFIERQIQSGHGDGAWLQLVPAGLCPTTT